ncbi:MAG: hydantoinase B/oxoprolinase family protein, partial [Maricaulaceae bacterium]
DVSEFILTHSRNATLAKIGALPRGKASGMMVIDGYDTPVTLNAHLEIQDTQILCDFTGSSGIDRNGINVPLVYTQAYACYALKCAVAPEVPNNAASLAPFVISAPENSIVNALHPAPVALRHVIGHMIPDTVYNALDKLLPATVPAEGAGTICNFQVSLRPSVNNISVDARRAEVLTFNSGGSGARPSQDGMSATAFPSGVMTMPVEATEHVGPVIIWRKELRPDSGGAGEFRGGLGQYMTIGAADGYEFDFSAMFDRVDHPAKGRQGGGDGAPTHLIRNDGQLLRGKGKHMVADGQSVELAFPGGAGYGDVKTRDKAAVLRDVARGYITTESAINIYGLSAKDVSRAEEALRKGENI